MLTKPDTENRPKPGRGGLKGGALRVSEPFELED